MRFKIIFPVRAGAQGSLCPVGAKLLYWGVTLKGAADSFVAKRRLFEMADFCVFRRPENTIFIVFFALTDFAKMRFSLFQHL